MRHIHFILRSARVVAFLEDVLGEFIPRLDVHHLGNLNMLLLKDQRWGQCAYIVALFHASAVFRREHKVK